MYIFLYFMHDFPIIEKAQKMEAHLFKGECKEFCVNGNLSMIFGTTIGSFYYIHNNKLLLNFKELFLVLLISVENISCINFFFYIQKFIFHSIRDNNVTYFLNSSIFLITLLLKKLSSFKVGS